MTTTKTDKVRVLSDGEISVNTLDDLGDSLLAAGCNAQPLSPNAAAYLGLRVKAIARILDRYPPRCPWVKEDFSGAELVHDQTHGDRSTCAVCGVHGTDGDEEIDARCVLTRELPEPPNRRHN